MALLATPAMAQTPDKQPAWVKTLDMEHGITSVTITIPMDSEIKAFTRSLAYRLNGCSTVGMKMPDLSYLDISTPEKRAEIDKRIPPCPNEPN
jgi:hypothetical protein